MSVHGANSLTPMRSLTTVLVMAKAPVPGRSKTRLCPPCTPVEAAAIAEAALADTLDVVRACAAERKVLALDGEPGSWLPNGFDVVAQVGLDFNDRLAAAWAEVSGPCLQIGMDTPQITATMLDAGLDAVTEGVAAALGLAADGGWWALGMHRPVPAVFAGVPMSTSHTGGDQLAALRAHGMEPVMLPVLSDIDTMVDARAVADTIPGSRTAALVAAVGAEAGR